MTFRWLLIVSLVLLPIHTRCATSTVAANLERANLDGLKNQFQTAMKSFSDVASLHYTLAGNRELGVQPPDSFCADIKRLVNKLDMESIYHATEAARTLGNCQVNLANFSSVWCLSLVTGRRLSFHDHVHSSIRSIDNRWNLLCCPFECEPWFDCGRASHREASECLSENRW